MIQILRKQKKLIVIRNYTNRLGIVFLSLITRIKSGNKPDVIGKPVKKQDQIKINDNGKKKQKKE